MPVHNNHFPDPILSGDLVEICRGGSCHIGDRNIYLWNYDISVTEGSRLEKLRRSLNSFSIPFPNKCDILGADTVSNE